MAERRSRNPLALLFGLAIKSLRIGDLSSKEMAKHLGINESTYRVFESGFTLIPPFYATRLVKSLPKLNWSRVVQALVAIQIVERDKSQQFKDGTLGVRVRRSSEYERMRGAIEDIAIRNPIFDEFWRTVARECFSGEALRAPDLSEHMEQRGLVARFASFLTDVDISAQQEEFGSSMKWLYSKLQRLSPYYFEMLAAQLSHLEHFPPRTTPEGLRHWENQNPQHFDAVFGIVRSCDLLVSEIPKFEWTYIDRLDFRGLFVLTFEDPNVAQEHLASLRGRLVARRRRGRSKSDTNAQALNSKVLIKSLRANDVDIGIQENIESLFRYDFSQGELVPFASSETALDLKNAWIYRMKDTGNVVALVDDKDQDASKPYQAAVLSWRSTRALYEKLEVIWKKELQQSVRRNRAGHSVAIK